ncbi:LuxR family transcriptional regulator [Agreia sp. Leaf283]|uniref:response regulator transcription factor n=1 Tax=Agreia sp. Leaf283 TaxID=1736321 RepID=UPI000724A016|nr:helix-turn-helix transcriptional regulator [Agreia sp. Leaf283]KQP56503.1 hypothetical protein ASF51_00790 [Agreia sp. Leaf283]
MGGVTVIPQAGHRYVAYKSDLRTIAESSGSNRDEHIARLRSIVLGGGTAIIAAAAGLGKSFVARGIAAAVTALGGSVSTVACVHTREDQLVDGVVPRSDLLIIEDAHLLSFDDAVRLTRLALDPKRSVLITIDSGMSCTAPRSEACHRELTTLWTEHGVSRIDLSGVGYDEAVIIIEGVAGRDRIDVVTRARILLLAEGNPRLLEELTREELHRGTYSARQQNILLGPSYMSPRILDFVRPLLRGMSDDEEYALVTLARLGALPFARAARLVGNSPLRSLLRRGLVSYDPRTPDSVSSRPIYAAAALAIQVGENPFEAGHTAELILLSDLSAGLELSNAECAFVAEYLVNEPGPDPLSEISNTEAAILLARAARHANKTGMPGSARMFAHRSLGYAPTLAGVEQLSRCLVAQGKFSEALDVLERVPVEHVDPSEDAAFLSWWMLVLSRRGPSFERVERLEKEARSWGTVDSALDEWKVFLTARSNMMLSTYRDGVAEMESIARDSSSSAYFVLRALTELMPCYVHRGEKTKFTWALEKGWALIAPILASNPEDMRWDPARSTTEFIIQASLVRATIGHDRAGLSRELESFALRTVDTADEYGMSLVNLVAGHLALEQSDAQRAENELARALERVGNSPQTKWVTWMQILRSNALAMLQRHDDALLLEREISPIERESTPWLAHYSGHLSARMRAYEGNVAGSIDACRTIADEESNSRFFAMRPLHVAAALGTDPSTLVAEIDRLPEQQMWDSTRLLEEHVRASASGDAPALERIGDELASLNHWWEAVLSYTTAATLFDVAGEEARRATALENARTTRSKLPATPKLGLVDNGAWSESPSIDPDQRRSTMLAALTPREREVATLAADGMSNAEIAARLYLSVRTVESHILQARSKLGDVRRSELASIVST